MSFHFHKQPPEVFCKKAVLKNSQISQETSVLESFFNNVPCLQACKFIKIDSNICVFLRNLRNFYRKSVNDCFALLMIFINMKAMLRKFAKRPEQNLSIIHKDSI